MQKIKIIFLSLSILILISSCQTIQKKSDQIAKKENEKLGKYIGKTMENLRTNMGKPNEDFINEKGNLELVYKTKKYGIPCERKFEIDSNFIVVGFVSNGCF